MYLDNLTPTARELVHPAEASNFRNHENAIRRAERDIPALEIKAAEVGGELAAEELRIARTTLANETDKLRALYYGAQVRALPLLRERLSAWAKSKDTVLAALAVKAGDVPDTFDKLLASDAEYQSIIATYNAVNAELSTLDAATANPYAA